MNIHSLASSTWCLLGALFLYACVPTEENQDTPYLDAATEVANWLSAQTTPDGRIPDEVMAPEAAFSASLGAGAGGRLLFFLEMYHATQDTTYLVNARSESQFIQASLDELKSQEETASIGLYNGMAGNLFALLEMEHLGKERLSNETLLPVVQLIGEGALQHSVNDVIVGIAGAGLTLLHLARENDDATRSYAVAMGDTLLNRGIAAGLATYWKRAQHLDHNLPNFSHGAAGIGYFLARLYEETEEPRFLIGAERAAQYLVEIADTSDQLFLVPYGIPNEGFVTKFDIGWAHGPAGTARLFHLLWEITGNEMYRDIVKMNVNTLLATGLPGDTRDSLRWAGPFTIDQRFGASGIVSFLLHQYRENNDTRALEFARLITDDILDKSILDAGKRYWVLPRFGFQGEEGADASFTGYFYGAAGLGLAFLDMHYAQTGKLAAVKFPDNPF